jgi:YidC/Oxa1 family membrane protein insertase
MLDVLYTIIIYPIVQIIELAFVLTGKVFKHTGLSVIGVSMAVSVLCLPLYEVAEKWQQLERDTQRKLKPKIDKIKAVFQGDEQYLIRSTYYKQNQYHPVFALRSVFGLLIQIPFFIAAYTYLAHLESLKGASFLFITDLGAPDNLIPIGKGIPVLPIIMTAINVAAGLVYTQGLPGKEKVQVLLTALVFLVLLYEQPAGLVLYWTMNNVFSLLKHGYHHIPYQHKRLLPAAFISLACICLLYFVFEKRISNAFVRGTFAVVIGLAGLLPWVFPLLKKLLHRIPLPEYTQAQVCVLFMSSCVLLWVVTGLLLPSLLVASAPQEFSYIDRYTTPLVFVCNTALQCFGFFVFWPLCIYLLFSFHTPKASLSGDPHAIPLVFTGTALVMGFCALCNVFAFPGNYGLISLDITFDGSVGHSLHEALLNLAVLSVLAIGGILLFLKKKYPLLAPLTVLCTLVIAGISVRHLVAIEQEFRRIQSFTRDTSKEIESIEPIATFSRTGKNTLVLMLDRATSAFVSQLYKEYPELQDAYEGFVYYPNTLSFNGYTRLGAPPIFGGYEYTPLELNKRDIPVVEKHNEALLLLPRIFSEAGYTVTVTDPPYPNYSFKDDLRIYEPYANVRARITGGVYTQLWLKEHDFHIPSQGDTLKRNIGWYSIFRISPLLFREGLYQQGSWWATVEGSRLMVSLNAYSVLEYLPRLIGIEEEEGHRVLIMVNNTTHDPSFMQIPEYRPSVSISDYGSGPFSKYAEYHGNAAAIMRLADWFAYLKKEKVYDTTRIIIVSDHGAQKDYISHPHSGLPNLYNFNPLLLVKDFNAHGPLKTDDTFMTNADVPFLALDGQIENPVNPFTGKRITTEAKQAPLYVAPSGGIHLENPQATQIRLNPEEDFYVYGKVLDPASWTKIEP